MKVVTIYESLYYNNDNDCDNEEHKVEYYGEQFWEGSDYLIISGEDIPIHFVIDNENDEVIVDTIYLDELSEEIILRFASEDYKKHFEEIMVGNDFKIEEDPKYDPGKAYIKYRGGSGYYYYHHHHQYKYDI